MGTFRLDDFILRGPCHYEGLLKEGEEGSQAFKKNPKVTLQTKSKNLFFLAWLGYTKQFPFRG